MTPLYRLYRIATSAVAPALPLYLRLRERRGKEDAKRLRERLGYASQSRLHGPLLWIHAASVGEANAVQPLIAGLKTRFPTLSLLLTTGTVTSARLMQERLPEGVLHQFVPVDTPDAVARFLAHWKPQIGLWVESELWPNLVIEADTQGCRMALLNARMSERSFHRWKRFNALAERMLACFSTVYAQSEEDASRFRGLGAPRVACLGNMKYDSALLVENADAIEKFAKQVEGRVVWIAASIHPGEDVMLAQAHTWLKLQFPALLSVIIPRHPPRAEHMRHVFETHNLHVVQRSLNESVNKETDVYLADTMGELAVFYSQRTPVFIGGSLVPHGGQNPLEAARLRCPLLCGPHMFNFSDISRDLIKGGGMIQVHDIATLQHRLAHLLMHADDADTMALRAENVVLRHSGVSERLLTRLIPWIEEAMHVARA